MARDYNNTHDLVTESDEDTSELEILPETIAAAATADTGLGPESESDAATHAFESLDKQRENESLATLQAELRERDECINRLEYDLEQQRARLTGLETEIKAREDLTDNVTAELTRAKQKLLAARERLERREQAIVSLKSDVRERDERLVAAERVLGETRQSLVSSRSESEALNERNVEAMTRIDSLTDELNREKSERLQAHNAARENLRLLRRKQDEHAEAHSTLDSLRQYIEGRKHRWEAQDKLLREKHELLEEQRQKVLRFTKDLKDDTKRLRKEQAARQELETRNTAFQQETTRLNAEVAELRTSADNERVLQKENAELSGRLAGNAAEIRQLRQQAAKIEAYGDTLRRTLQSRAAETDAAAAAQRHLQDALDAALAKVEELEAQLEAERKAHAELAAENRDAREKFEAEVREIRFELTTAEETIAENETINEHLTSELLETTGSRLALESQLAESDEAREKTIEGLRGQMERLSKQIDGYERKLKSKDAAINVLLTELANKPHAGASVASENEADTVVHKLGDRRTSNPEDAHGHDKDRITRLLIGTIDGQEVRFPLFKNKLTIGRTAHNDIQLKAQYVSRRHAVVVCDNDCTRIADWGSKNGIYVNGVRVSEKILKNGDQVTVGTARFKFEERPKR